MCVCVCVWVSSVLHMCGWFISHIPLLFLVSRVNALCPTTYGRVILHLKRVGPGWVVSHTWMSHVSLMMSDVSRISDWCLSYEWVMSHIRMSQVSHMNESCLPYEWVMSHIWMNHVSHMNESCLTYENDMSHASRQWISHVSLMMSDISHMNASYHACTCFISHTWIRHGTPQASESRVSHAWHMNESRFTYEWVMSHIWMHHHIAHVHVSCHTWMSHTPHMNESRFTHEWVMSHIWTHHVTHNNHKRHTSRSELV